jgi:hypothetical protein
MVFEIYIFAMNIYIMSIATLKRKTAAKYNNMSVGVPQFSINGGYRNQGWVGQTSLSRSLPKTPMRGGEARGHGGCCDTFNVTMITPPVTSTNDNTVIKGSVLATNGLLDTKYRWIRRPAPFTSVKPDATHSLNSQTDYITRKKKRIVNSVQYNCPSMPAQPYSCISNCNMFKSRLNTPHSNNIKYVTKEVGPLTGSAYTMKLGNECESTDVEFQDQQNNKTTSTPFGC